LQRVPEQHGGGQAGVVRQRWRMKIGEHFCSPILPSDNSLVTVT
jgi:hypothetical protein